MFHLKTLTFAELQHGAGNILEGTFSDYLLEASNKSYDLLNLIGTPNSKDKSDMVSRF